MVQQLCTLENYSLMLKTSRFGYLRQPKSYNNYILVCIHLDSKYNLFYNL